MMMMVVVMMIKSQRGILSRLLLNYKRILRQERLVSKAGNPPKLKFFT